MGRYHNAILGVRMEHTGVDEDAPRTCRRCPRQLNNRWANTVYCHDCRNVVRFEEMVDALGIDLSLLEDDEFIRFRKKDGGGYRYTIVKDKAVAA